MSASNEDSLPALLVAIGAIPALVSEFRQLRQEFAALREKLELQPDSATTDDGWLDAKDAARYMGLSPGTFEKYRYRTSHKITGYKLDGKTLFKRSDLDTFVRLYELKSSGLA